MSRAFETIEIVEDSPKFFVIGDSPIAMTLVDNLLSGGAQVFCLSNKDIPRGDNLFQISANQISNISRDVKYVFFEKEQTEIDEISIVNHLPSAKFIYLNPKSIKKNSIMIFSPLIYGEGIVDEAFGFIAFNEKNVIHSQELVFPENFTEEIKPVYFLDVVEMIEKAMFSMSTESNENLILLEGSEKISLSAFLGMMKATIKAEIKVKYLQKKFSFHIPNIGVLEKSRTAFSKAIPKTVDFLTSEIEKQNQMSAKPKSTEESRPVDLKTNNIFLPEEKKAEKPNEKVEEIFVKNDEFIKNIYRENIEYLENNLLLKKKIKKENGFEKLSSKFAKIKSFKLNFPKIQIPKIQKLSNFKLIPSLKFFKKILFFLFLIFSPVLIFYSCLIFSVFSVTQSANSLQKFEISESKKWQNRSRVSYDAANFLNINVTKYYYYLLNDRKSLKNMRDFLILEGRVIELLSNVNLSLENLSEAMSVVFDEHSKVASPIDKKIQNSAVYLKAAKDNLSLMIADLKNNIPSLPLILKFKNKEYFSQIKLLPSFYQNAKNFSELLNSLSGILGDSREKTYAIVFQNNMELRSTGGFIGSFALVSFEKQKMIDFQIYDVYDADGQLLGHIDPPPEILHFLKQPDYFLRDSNVSPDFPKSAEMISWFLAKEMKAQIEGVIAIDVTFVENILKNTGPIYLSDFKETVTAQNLFEKAERASEVDYFPGSKSKKDFLSVLSNNLWLRILEPSQKENLPKVMRTIQDSIETRNFQVYLADPNVSHLPSLFHADGKMMKVEGAEYLNIIENNYGANKANYFVKRKIDHEINLTKDGYVQHVLKVSYDNFSPFSMWPTGDYKPYVKLYVGKTHVISDFKFEDKKPKFSEFLNEFVLENLKTDTEQLVLQGEEDIHKYFGTFITIPTGKTKQVIFSWQTKSPNLNILKQFNYYFQKQAGIFENDYSLEVSFPNELSAKSNLTPSLASDGILKYNLKTERDISLQLNFK